MEEKRKTGQKSGATGGRVYGSPCCAVSFCLSVILLVLILEVAHHGLWDYDAINRVNHLHTGSWRSWMSKARSFLHHRDRGHRFPDGSKIGTSSRGDGSLRLHETVDSLHHAKPTVHKDDVSGGNDCSDVCTSANTYTTVVVGGGISGLYSAWRLQNHSSTGRIAVLEASGRFGGRVFSINLPGLPDVPADLGAMHYLEDDVSVQSYLIKHVLSLGGIDFPTDSSDPRLPFVLRGRRFTMEQLSNVSEITKVYALTEKEQSLYSGPGSLYEYYVHQLVPNYDNASIDPWKEKTSDGRYVKDLGWLELAILANMSDEAMHLIIDSSGFADFWDNPNAAALAVQHTTFLHASEYKTFSGGMSDLVNALVHVLETMPGVELIPDRRVTAVEKCGSLYKLTAGSAISCGQQVILALPYRALSTLDWSVLKENPAWQSVTPVHGMKLYLGYDTPWWRNPPTQSQSGWLYSNLPIQQVLYLGSQADHKEQKDATNTNSLLMAMYCTEQFTTIWESLSRDQASLNVFHGRPNAFAHNTSPPIVPELGRPVTTEMLATVHKQLAALHNLPVSAIPEPYTAALIDWPAAWHWWKPGANASDLSNQVAQLSPNDKVFVVGEAYSNLQGWIQGALSNAEQVLQSKLGIPPFPNMPMQKQVKQPNLWHHVRFGHRLRRH